MIPGSRSCRFFVCEGPLTTYVLAPMEACTLGIVFTPRRLSVFCRRLSSVPAVLCTAFFFRRTVPFPPMRTSPAMRCSFSMFICVAARVIGSGSVGGGGGGGGGGPGGGGGGGGGAEAGEGR